MALNRAQIQFRLVARISGKCDDNALLKRLGLEIRQLRKSIGLSQEDLADAAGIERAHMGRIERGERNVSILNVARISTALGTTPGALLTLLDD